MIDTTRPLFASLDDSYRSFDVYYRHLSRNSIHINDKKQRSEIKKRKELLGLWVYTSALARHVANKITTLSYLTLLTPYAPSRFSEEHQKILKKFLSKECMGYKLVPCTHYSQYDSDEISAHSFVNKKLKKNKILKRNGIPKVVRFLYDVADYHANRENKLIFDAILRKKRIPQRVIIIQEKRTLEGLLS